MNAAVAEMTATAGRTARYARAVKMSKKVEWQIDRDLVRDRGVGGSCWLSCAGCPSSAGSSSSLRPKRA